MGYFNQAMASPGMGGGGAFGTPPNTMNPSTLATLMAMQNGGGAQGGMAPQMPSPLGKAGSNAGAMSSPIASQPNNGLLAQLMANPSMLQNLLKSLGSAGVPGLGGTLAGLGGANANGMATIGQ